MRVEATLPEAHGKALDELTDELGLSRSQILDEALALFIKAVLEARRGRRLVAVGEEGGATCEIATPTLAQLEWLAHRQSITVSGRGMKKLARLLESPPEPTPALRRAMAKRGR